MKHRNCKKLSRSLLNVLLSTFITYFTFIHVAHSAPDLVDKTAYFLALKGGVSLGSYETGINRVLLRYMQDSADANVVAFSGASAGSINSILSAIDVCIKDKTYANFDSNKNISDNIDSNFMKFSWDMGIDELLPDGSGDSRALYSPGNRNKRNFGVFSRKGFVKKKNIIEAISQKDAVGECELTITMSVTKFVPHNVAIKEIGAYIRLQRFVVAIDAKVVNNKLAFVNSTKNVFKKNDDDIPNEYIQLVENKTGEIEFDEIWELAQASSAFPVAFHPVSLNYCLPHELREGEKCTSDVARNDLFSDGGLFDNAPIGVAWDIATELGTKYKRIRLLYINPDSYRPNPENNTEKLLDKTRTGLSEYKDYFLAALATAHELEYSSSLRKILKTKKDAYFTTNRFHHLLADLHLHFGAFYAEEYRTHDYLVGVYDGEHMIAQLICNDTMLEENRLSRNYSDCIKNEHLKRIRNINEIEKDSKDFLLYLYDVENKTAFVSKNHKGASKNVSIVLNKAFGHPEKNPNITINYADYLKNLSYFSEELVLAKGSDLEKIINDGPTYTASKVAGIYENLIHMQELSSRCPSCDGSDFNDSVESSLKAVEPVVDSYLQHYQSNVWPKPFFESLGFSYGFNESQKNQIFSIEGRPYIDLLAKNNFSIDFAIDFNRFGGELEHDHYYGGSVALVYHTDNIMLPTWSLGYQHDGEGDVLYKSELDSIFLKVSFANEIISLKYMYAIDDVVSYPVSTRDDESFIILVDVSRLARIAWGALY